MVLTAQDFANLMPDATQLESDEPEIESSLHYLQLALLVASLDWLWRERNDYFMGANLTIYFSRQQLKHRDFRGLDFFLVKDTEKRPRKSWVVWEEEGKYPDLIIELLSPSTAIIDRTLKKTLYQETFRTQEYFWYSPENLEIAGFKLVEGTYEAIEVNENGLRWSEVLELYLGVYNQQLRYFDRKDHLIPTPEEEALKEKQRTEILAAKLRELGINPDDLT